MSLSNPESSILWRSGMLSFWASTSPETANSGPKLMFPAPMTPTQWFLLVSLVRYFLIWGGTCPVFSVPYDGAMRM